MIDPASPELAGRRSKVPEVTLAFWIVKLLATTVARRAVTRCP